jgi:hypothetical protein
VTKTERDQKLNSLKTEVQSWAKKERERLVAERRFLQAVLDQSLGGATERADELSKLTALNELASVAELQ